MSRKLLIETSEGTREIHYGALSSGEITRRISEYEKRYGSSFVQFSKHLSCDQIGPQEMTDVMDWECLETERASRQNVSYVKHVE